MLPIWICLAHLCQWIIKPDCLRGRGQLTGKLVISQNLEHKTYLECNHCFNVFIGSPESQFFRTIESSGVGLLSDLSSGSVLMCTVGGEAGAGL